MSFSPIEWQIVRFTLAVCAFSTLLILPVGLAMAWLLDRYGWPGKVLVETVVTLPLVLPPVATGLLLLKMFGRRGPIGYFLNQQFDIDVVFTWRAVVLATAVMSFPLVVRAMRLALEGVDPGLEDAARTLGAGPIDRFLSVTLPLMAPGILAGAVTAFAASLGEFGAVITFAGNVPGQTQTLPLALYSALETPDGAATAARLATLSVVLGVAGLLLAELLARRTRAWLGR